MKSHLLPLCVLIAAFGTSCKEDSAPASPEQQKPGTADLNKTTAASKSATKAPTEAPSPEVIKVAVNGAELEVTKAGEGPAILFIHGLALSDALVPLASDATFADGFQRISYTRRGFDGKPTKPASMEEQAEDAATILKTLKIDKAHVVGHSLGANIAMQLARSHKDMVASLILMEPMLWHESESGRVGEAAFGAVFQEYGKGEKAKALNLFLTSNAGPDSKKFIDSDLPKGSYDQALANIDTLFKVDLLALLHWKFSAEKRYEGLTMPVLFISGAKSVAPMRDAGDVVAKWFPQTKRAEIADVDHLFPFRKPAEVAAHIVGFLKTPAQ